MSRLAGGNQFRLHSFDSFPYGLPVELAFGSLLVHSQPRYSGARTEIPKGSAAYIKSCPRRRIADMEGCACRGRPNTFKRHVSQKLLEETLGRSGPCHFMRKEQNKNLVKPV